MCYTVFGYWAPDPSAPTQVMRLRRAVLQSLPKSSVPPRLPLYKTRPPLTHLESTLLQVLIPLHFISFISNTYKKPGKGTPSSSPKVWQLVTTRRSPHGPHRKARNPNPLYALLHYSLHTPGVGSSWSTKWDSQSWLSPSILPNSHPPLKVRAFSAYLCGFSASALSFPSPFLRPRLSTVDCRPPLPARNSQARYAIVRWHRFSRTNQTRHSERSEESHFSGRGKDRHAQAPKQGAEEKWQSAPYL
jgi:hypothetical protein